MNMKSSQQNGGVFYSTTNIAIFIHVTSSGLPSILERASLDAFIPVAYKYVCYSVTRPGVTHASRKRPRLF